MTHTIDDDGVVCARDAGKEDTSERIEAAQQSHDREQDESRETFLIAQRPPIIFVGKLESLLKQTDVVCRS